MGSEGQPYLALEYVEGIAITDYCQLHGLSVETRIKLFLQVCEAVSHAHANLIVHRDLKPSNILVTPTGEVRLLDFGIAKLLDDPEPAPLHPRTEVRAFTLHYAAPEQIRGEPVTTMTDVYSLGVVLYEVLAGTKPYRLRRQTDAEWEQAILAVEPLKPSVAAQRSTDGGRRQRCGCAATGAPAQRRHRQHRAEGAGESSPSIATPRSKRCRWTCSGTWRVARCRRGPRAGCTACASTAGATAGPWPPAPWSTSLLLAALAASAWQSRQAMRETARAQAMQDFVIGLFDNAGVAQQGNIFDARKLLIAGERRGERELAEQPLAHAELLGVIARLRLGLGDYQEALALIERQDALLSQLDSVPPGVSLEAVTQRGRALDLLDRSRECLQVMAAGESMISGLRAAQPLPVADFLSQYGRCHRLLGQRQAAREFYERSLSLRRSIKDQSGVAQNLYDLALLDNDMGRPDQAMAGYDEALAHVHKHVGRQNALAAGDRVQPRTPVPRCAATRQSRRPRSARRLCIAKEIHGEQHPVDAGHPGPAGRHPGGPGELCGSRAADRPHARLGGRCTGAQPSPHRAGIQYARRHRLGARTHGAGRRRRGSRRHHLARTGWIAEPAGRLVRLRHGPARAQDATRTR